VADLSVAGVTLAWEYAKAMDMTLPHIARVFKVNPNLQTSAASSPLSGPRVMPPRTRRLAPELGEPKLSQGEKSGGVWWWVSAQNGETDPILDPLRINVEEKRRPRITVSFLVPILRTVKKVGFLRYGGLRCSKARSIEPAILAAVHQLDNSLLL
jgi:hypothetical protein